MEVKNLTKGPTVIQGRDGKKVEELFRISHNGTLYDLNFTTSKSSGGIGSHASILKVEGRSRTCMPFSAYFKRFRDVAGRATEGKLLEIHRANFNQAVSDGILEDIRKLLEAGKDPSVER